MVELGDAEQLTGSAASCLPEGEGADEVARELNYFTDNAAKMQYARFKADGLFVGSGVIEAGCKSVIGSRLKQSGMFWTLDGANAIISLRCRELSCPLPQAMSPAA